MAHATGTSESSIDTFVRQVIQQYRTKLLDLTSRNPLISFRHSERSRSHIRMVDEVPEKLFEKLISGKQLFFDPLPDPELTPADETTTNFQRLLRRAKSEDPSYIESLTQLGPNASTRQKQKLERDLCNRVRADLGLAPFQPTWDPQKRAKEVGLNPDYELPAQAERRHNGSKIQALFFAEDLDRKLSGLQDAARVLEKDAGFNALFCSFGYLEYYESGHSDEKRVAPLVFLPITLDRVLTDQRYRYYIKSRNEDVEINVALLELLKQMNVSLPAWDDDETLEAPLENYFKRVKKAIAGQRDWSVRRYATMGLFTFSTLAMYKDLDPQRWPAAEPLEKQQVLRTLIAGAEVSDVKYADDYEIDTLQGPEPLLITDADSSQHSAVVDVLRSKTSQVIQGPPGTGKSQTITNIVAAALNEGLSVMFVAEKMAALDVVKKRLDAAGLEAFCLELHSSKTSKTAVTESLSQRIEYRVPRLRSDLAASNAEALRDAKAELLYYVQRVNQDAGKTGLKIYDILLGSAIREDLKGGLPPDISDARLANPLDIYSHTYRQMLDAAATLESQMQPLAVFGKLADHPWRGIQNIEITELDEGRLFALISEWNDGIAEALAYSSAITERVGHRLPETQASLETFCDQILLVPAPPEPLCIDAYSGCRLEANRRRLQQAIQAMQALFANEAQLELLTDDVAAARQVGGASLSGALDKLHALAIIRFTVGSLTELNAAQQELAAKTSALQSFCEELASAAGFQETGLSALRAIVAASDLLARLPRELWHLRSPEVLDEKNQGTLNRAAGQQKALLRIRAELESEFDLRLLPECKELQTCGVALKTANVFTAVLSSNCRRGRRIYRGISREQRRKRRIETADGLLRCASYLAEMQALVSNTSLRSACGQYFSEFESPFGELLQVSEWGTSVRQRLASFGDAGLTLRSLLFDGAADQLDRLLAYREQPPFAALGTVLSNFREADIPLWTDLVHQQKERAAITSQALRVIQQGGFRQSCSEENLRAAVGALAGAERNEKCIENDQTVLSLVGGSCEAMRQKFEALVATLGFAKSVATLPLPQDFVAYFFDDAAHIIEMRALAQGVLQTCATLKRRVSTANDMGQFDWTLWCGTDSFDSANFQQVLQRNRRALEHVSALRDYLNFLLAEDAAVDQGVGPVLSAYSTSGLDYCNLTRAVECVFFRSAAEAVLKNDPRLRRHSGANHQELRNQFRTLDREYLELRRKQLAVALSQRRCPAGNAIGPVAELTDLALVTRVAGQTRPRITVRELVRRAGKAIQALKPCWMMSPMSVAQYLAPGDIRFDLLIMDEASQIRPEEALGSIARAAKAVIVGDQMQLPPTPFFQKLSQGELDEGEFEDSKEDSVLEAAAGRFYPARRLKWHYRSEHGSLIAFSNHEFYNDQLTVFPSPYYDHPRYGVSLVQAGGTYEAGFNEVEGRRVVSAAVEFMKNCPNESLGIVAVNAKQAEFIREQLDRECATDENSAAYVQKWEPTLESLFVKNLENVQGDERDVIFISTVYGKDRKGSFFQRFGPINGIYGHRRLNVLFTRAKKKVTVFTSMIPEEIQEEDKHWGVKVLKGYLQFARDGMAVLPNANGECESEFEQWVLQVLQSHGYQGVPQVGVCGYRIDIAVRHPVNAGTFLCGIECDGATYHSARSVRERDRLRQEILEKYGWKLYRIWSTDWFRNPSLQTKHLLKYLRELHPASVSH